MSPTEHIVKLLSALGSDCQFATHFPLVADPQLNIEGIGAVPLPITSQVAHQLCAIAQPAVHGYKDQTRLDPNVRDTWEIPAHQIRCESPEWQNALQQALDQIKQDFGLPATTQLQAVLHNLLIYGPGQFFTMHQDSEKTDGMLGTLVILLPSHFTGGEFIISHQGETRHIGNPGKHPTMIAFYADCHHEVRPVKQGYRVVLTYQLIMRGRSRNMDIPEETVEALTKAVHEFWHTPAAPRWHGDTNTKPPDRLVFLLDHQYTQSSLGWSALKGADAIRVAALRNVAQRLNVELFLALADVHEVWSSEDDYLVSQDWLEDIGAQDDAVISADRPLDYLIDSDIELRYWISLDGKATMPDASGEVSLSELCITRASVDCPPIRSEYEGYMGNYGNTVDRWYHRAALVMWPAERAFLVRARLSPQWALANISDKLTHQPAEALATIHQILPIWPEILRRAGRETLLSQYLEIAFRLDNAQAAYTLLSPYSLTDYTRELCAWWPQLLARYGLEWCLQLVLQDKPSQFEADRQLDWTAQVFPTFAQHLAEHSPAEGPALVAPISQQCWRWIQRDLSNANRCPGKTARHNAMRDVIPAITGLVIANHHAQCQAVQYQVSEILVRENFPIVITTGVLQTLAEQDISRDIEGLGQIHTHCFRLLARLLHQPERHTDDWSILSVHNNNQLPATLFSSLLRFLQSSTERHMEWPLVTADREAIIRFIEDNELPVEHTVKRKGRPYTLILEKSLRLFEEDAAMRIQWQAVLEWLKTTEGLFSK